MKKRRHWRLFFSVIAVVVDVPAEDGADDRVDSRGLRAAGAVDFHRLPVYLADADDPVHLLPGHLGGDGAGAPCDLHRHPAAVPVAGPRGPGDVLPQGNCIKIRPRGEKRGLFACFFANNITIFSNYFTNRRAFNVTTPIIVFSGTMTAAFMTRKKRLACHGTPYKN